MPFARDDPEAQARITVFVQELQKLGWTEGRNLQIEYRWETADPQKAAAELVALSPDVIFTIATPAVAALQQATRNVPIVFAQVADPLSGGFVASLAKPGGNITGFTVYDYGMGAKWVELLREIAPYVTHVGVIRDPTNAQAKPPVYAIALNQVTDAEGYAKEYLPKGRAAILAHGGVYVAAGNGAVITGDAPHDRVIVLRFESLDAVKVWFNSPDYQAANQIGQKYAHYNIIAVDGVQTKQ
jgi:uncharacterized protein (DUF1330 family)